MHAPLVVTSTNVNVKALPHASDAVAAVKIGVAGQLIVVGAGSGAMTGAVISWTVMVCVAVEELPHKSVAVHVLVILYAPAQAPGVNTSDEPNEKEFPHASETVTLNTGEAGQLIVVGGGSGEMTGGVTS